MGRPRKKLDEGFIEKLAGTFCTTAEIADWCGVSRDTIERRYAKVVARGKSKGKTTLRQLQWASARKGNVTMQIWLGKQLLGQSDQVEPPDDATEEYIRPSSMRK
jgi:hypothetical protein